MEPMQMQERSPRRPWKRTAVALVTALAFGWLSSGSCQVSYCSEDCDPCVVQCRCRTSACYYSSSTLQALHTLKLYERSEGYAAEGELHQSFSDIRGLSVQLVGGPPAPEVADCVRFARGVLSVNAALFARPGAAGEFDLVQAHASDTGALVQFQRERDGRATDLVTLFFDPRGSLLQIDHDARDSTN
ncbi:MAG: hypothetical protein JNL28_14055 [Planctomycetes bacterium]|nr:hypothetical protein [Planctomycetota bacterium]